MTSVVGRPKQSSTPPRHDKHTRNPDILFKPKVLLAYANGGTYSLEKAKEVPFADGLAISKVFFMISMIVL
jgi:hypothetical protein